MGLTFALRLVITDRAVRAWTTYSTVTTAGVVSESTRAFEKRHRLTVRAVFLYTNL